MQNRISTFVASVLLAAVAAACGATTSSPAAPTATPPSSPSTTTPVSATASAAPGPTLPPGTLVLDTVSAIRSMELSPDGTLLAVLVTDKQSDGTIELFTAAGVPLATFAGTGATWVDATRLATFQPGSGVVNGSVTIHPVDGSAPQALPGSWGGILGNGHGSLVLESAFPQGAYGGDHFQVWSNGRLGPLIAGYGMPWTWSPDGTLLLLHRDLATVTGPAGLVLADTGSIEAELKVLRFPGGTAPASFPAGIIVDSRMAPPFSPDSRYLAADGVAAPPPGERPAGPLVIDLGWDVDVGGGSVRTLGVLTPVLGWAPDGRVVVQSTDGHVLLWGLDGTLSDPGLPSGQVRYGPTMTDLVLPNVGSGPAVTIQTSRGSVAVPMHVYGAESVIWAPDGRSVFIDTGSTDAQQIMDELLRVPLP